MNWPRPVSRASSSTRRTALPLPYRAEPASAFVFALNGVLAGMEREWYSRRRVRRPPGQRSTIATIPAKASAAPASVRPVMPSSFRRIR